MTGQFTVVLIAQAIGTAFAAGSLLLLVLTLLPRTRPVAWQLWPILGSEAVILAGGILPWLLPQAGLFAILLLAAGRIGFESGTVHGLASRRQFRFSHMLVLVAASSASWVAGTTIFLVTATLLFAIALLGVRKVYGTSLTGGLARFILFPFLPVAAFSHTASNPALAPVLVLSFFLVEIFDSFSLLGGRLFGRRPLVPRLSPRKTWEGLATGTAALFMALLGLVVWLGLPLIPIMVAGVAVIVAAMAGDLAGSDAKRRAGVKDYPAVMRVQGGLLDIMDSWLVAGPCLAGMFALWNSL